MQLLCLSMVLYMVLCLKIIKDISYWFISLLLRGNFLLNIPSRYQAETNMKQNKRLYIITVKKILIHLFKDRKSFQWHRRNFTLLFFVECSLLSKIKILVTYTQTKCRHGWVRQSRRGNRISARSTETTHSQRLSKHLLYMTKCL